MRAVSFFILLTIGHSLSIQAKDTPAKTRQPQSNSSLTVEVSYDYDTGIPTRLTFDARSDRKKIWLGVSLYPRTVADPLKDGEHSQIELNSERTGRSLKVGKKFTGGSFEAALWGKRVARAECTIPNCYWCGKNGFHLDELLFYKSGVFLPPQ